MSKDLSKCINDDFNIALAVAVLFSRKNKIINHIRQNQTATLCLDSLIKGIEILSGRVQFDGYVSIQTYNLKSIIKAIREDKLDNIRKPIELYDELMGSKNPVMILIMLPETITIRPEYTSSSDRFYVIFCENEIVDTVLNCVEIP